MTDPTLMAGIRRRGKKFSSLLAKLDSEAEAGNRKKLQQELESLQGKIHQANAEFPKLSSEEKQRRISALRPISDRVAEIKQTLRASAVSVSRLPNIPAADVPDGDDEDANVVEREVGRKRALKNPQDYLTLTELKNLIDLKRAAKVSGSRFGYILGPLAQMEFALVQYAQKVLLPVGFTMVVPPVMIQESNMEAMGYLSGGGESETYHLDKDKLYLVGTSEQSIGPMHRDEVFVVDDLPKRYLSFSTCFRREAGSYGKDTKGILRVHQFDKLEMFSFTLPEKSDEEHAWLLSLQEQLWQGLDIHYRVVKLCAGDLGWPSARTWDIEAWMPGQDTYREVSSTSTTTDYQSRALNIKVQRDGGKEFVHLLNGTAFAIGRTLIAIIENYQQSDGSIAVPKVLQPFMGKTKFIGRT